jgi:hypothetical protein
MGNGDRYTMGRGFNILWIGDLIYHGKVNKIPLVEDPINHG